jgi:hypothetical protein
LDVVRRDFDGGVANNYEFWILSFELVISL